MEEEPITIEDLFRSIGSRITSHGDLIFRPTNIHGFTEVDPALVKNALQEIVTKLSFVQIGLDKFSACETLAFLMIRNHAKMWH